MKKLLLLTCILVLGLSGCGKKTTDDADSGTDDSSTSSYVQSSLESVTDAISADAGVSSQPFSVEGDDQIVSAASDLSPFADCSTVSFDSCIAGVKVRSFNQCTRTSSAGGTVTAYGMSKLTYLDSSCSMGTTNNYFVRSFEGHYRSTALGYKVLSYTGVENDLAGVAIGTADLQDYTGTVRSGGTKVTTTGANTRTIEISGVHRRGLRANGEFGFWHTTYTSSPLQVSKSGSTYTIVSGSVNVASNRLGLVTSTTYSGVEYDPSVCCYPIAGTVTVSVGSATPVVTTFSSTCGSVQLDSTVATLPTCGGN
jgi:hypothetical protein